MEIKEFAEIIREELESRTGLEVAAKEVRKNNNTILHGICISEPGCNVVPTIYLESYYEAYESGVSLGAVIERIYELYKTDKPRVSFDTNWFMDWERVKGSIGFRLINYNRNKELLDEIPYTRFLDLVKVYYVAVESKDIGSGSILIYNSHLEIWGVTTEQLETIAAENTPNLFPVQFSSMKETLEELNPFDYDLSELDFMEWPMYVVSNSKKIHGAAVMCYPNAIRNFAEQLESDLYILPSSIHELILVLPNEDLEERNLKSMVYEVNEELVAEEEILSNSVYKYSRETESITIL